MLAGQRMTMGEYFVLMNLSEADGCRLQISQLARRGTLSTSRMSRLVDELIARGWIRREKCATDARSSYAVLTPAGRTRLEEAYPTHLESVRRNVMDHLAGLDMTALAEAFGRFAGGAPLDSASCDES
jgi:DNA-binding MarR family transcriptional regulator